jgi:[acyl-carrier-protein] S-malonyltransferase
MSSKKIAFVCPGQGSQKVGMGKDAAEASPAARSVFDAADHALGEPLSKLCFEGPEGELMLTANTQPAVLTTSIAILRALGETPDLAAGQPGGTRTGARARWPRTRASRLRDSSCRRRSRRRAMAAILKVDDDVVSRSEETEESSSR